MDWNTKLDKWRIRRNRIYQENKAGKSWNELAKKYKVSVTAIGEIIKKAKRDAGE
jgi:Mor family transcriptional regulator